MMLFILHCRISFTYLLLQSEIFLSNILLVYLPKRFLRLLIMHFHPNNFNNFRYEVIDSVLLIPFINIQWQWSCIYIFGDRGFGRWRSCCRSTSRTCTGSSISNCKSAYIAWCFTTQPVMWHHHTIVYFCLFVTNCNNVGLDLLKRVILHKIYESR